MNFTSHKNKAIDTARMYSQTAYSDYLLDRILSEDPDMDYTNAKKRLDLLKDVYHQFFKENPKENIDADRKIKKVFDTLNQIDDFKHMKLSTVGDKRMSYIAAAKFEEQFKLMLREIESSERKDFDHRDDLVEFIGKNQDRFRFMLREHLKKVKEEVDMEETLEGMGVGKAAKPGDSFKEVVKTKKLGKSLLANEAYKKIVDILGRFKRMADNNMRMKTEGLEELVGITMGDDLDNVLPEELAEFTDPDTEVLFLEKYCNKNLLQYDAKSKEPEGKGDIIAVMDESGSMVECPVYLEGEAVSRLAVSRAILFGLASIAKQQKRRLRVIRFDGAAIEGKFDSMEDIMHFAINGRVKGGGTDYNNMLSLVMAVMDEEKKKKSDVLIVSDGESHVDNKLLEEFKMKKDSLGFKVVSLMIGGYGYVLQKFSDVVFDNLTGDSLKSNSAAMQAAFGM